MPAVESFPHCVVPSSTPRQGPDQQFSLSMVPVVDLIKDYPSQAH
jgi:hypothetical protein